MQERIDIHDVPAGALYVLDALEQAGFEAWIVGGWVRDTLCEKTAYDVDVMTVAHWREAARALTEAGCEVQETGTAHGTVTACQMGTSIEVTTYRVDGDYSDHRHPDEVRFVKDAAEDLARRDLTINAMAWHPLRGLLDPFGGLEDLRAGRIRTVGNPERRFKEDALRIMRAVRFSLQMGFAVETTTQDALTSCSGELAHVAPERIGLELDRIVRLGKAGRALLEQPDVMCASVPELSQARGFDQRSVYHIYDVYGHIAHVCNAVEAFSAGLARPELRWAALLHDIAKPCCYSEDVDGHGHFFNHPDEGARMAARIMRRMGMTTSLTDAVCVLIQLHDEPLPLDAEAMRRLLARIATLCPGQETALAFSLFNLRRADAVAKCVSAARWASTMDGYASLLRAEIARGPVFQTRHLAIRGADIIHACHVAPGPAVGLKLYMALDAVMRGEVPNEYDALLSWVSNA